MFNTKSLLTKASYIVLGMMIAANAANANSFTSDELDIDEAWRGAAVSAKFGAQDAEHNYTGVINGYTGQFLWYDAGEDIDKLRAEGYVSASVL